ncbi:MAG: Uma2 family endonuclease [Leptolyngbya sp. SIOISBB]|nr:Uma2 family endonuclease [Leptolyngbya sp. SIOISBB]
MNPRLLEKLNAHPELLSDPADQQYPVTGMSWPADEALLADLGDDCPGLRVHYLEGTLEITLPGRQHEVIKDHIAGLLRASFEETRTRCYGLGSTTLRAAAKRRGAEPDVSFGIGIDKEFPDIAIKVVQTSGGVNKRLIYQGLSVVEVGFWQNDQVEVYRWQGERYERREHSEIFPALELSLLATDVRYPEPFDAVIEFRQALRSAQ